MLSRHLCGHHAIDVLAILARFITRSWSRKERRTKPHPRPAMASCSPLLARPRDLLRCCRLSLEISLAYSPSMHTERDRESERERARETERIRERERERNRQTQADRQAHSEGMANIERGTRGERIERVFVVYPHLFFLFSRLFQSISGCRAVPIGHAPLLPIGRAPLLRHPTNGAVPLVWNACHVKLHMNHLNPCHMKACHMMRLARCLAFSLKTCPVCPLVQDTRQVV